MQKTRPDAADMAPSAAAQTETKAGPRTRRGRYISDSILERRRRMLEVAKAMIAEGGSDGFTIREHSRRAKVSVTTIYATYGDKEGLIAAAIQDYFDGLPVARTRPTTSLPAVLAATDLAREAILANKAYARQYIELFFSRTVDARIYKAIQDTATASNGRMPWLQKVMREGDLIPGVELGYVVASLANQGLMVLHDWAQGRIEDEDLATAIKMGFLTFARGVTRGPTQARVESELKKLLRAAGSASSE